MALAVLIAIAFLTQCASGYLICEQLQTGLCTYAIASNGRRCVLENLLTKDGRMQLECKTSTVTVGFMDEWIETDECVNACGLDRNSVGISSDDLLRRGFTSRLCSSDCYRNCPNVVDLYFNLALAEGGFLPNICESERNPRRVMTGIRSSSAASSPAIATAAAPCSDNEHCGTAAYPPAESPAY
ncbi:hypothetical protein MLD38_006848 [Melastoma candidum]|uniref:Uncharacterized protein n=1 Tax=Melastoma candidum TaxID=119954 RepID=A0ACB9RNR1_9MYRT|nr:hypothetical protein MLD38_006848 [Melastoma candidum]